MKVGLLSNSLPKATRQIVLALICVCAFVINTGNARINSRPLTWLTDDKMASLQADDTADLTHENSETSLLRRENPTDNGPDTTPSPYRAMTETADLIPKVNGLSFVNDYPRVMRFHAGLPSLQWTTPGTAESEMDGVRSLGQSADAPADGKKCGDVETPAGRRFSLQGVVAGASFVGGLAVSMSVCLLCYRIRRRTSRRTIDQKQLNESSSSVVSAVLDSEQEEGKTEP